MHAYARPSVTAASSARVRHGERAERDAAHREQAAGLVDVAHAPRQRDEHDADHEQGPPALAQRLELGRLRVDARLATPAADLDFVGCRTTSRRRLARRLGGRGGLAGLARGLLVLLVARIRGAASCHGWIGLPFRNERTAGDQLVRLDVLSPMSPRRRRREARAPAGSCPSRSPRASRARTACRSSAGSLPGA